MKMKIASLLIVALLSTACAAFDVGPANTANGLLRAVQNAPGTFMMASDKLIMIAWPEGSSSYGFAVFTKDGNSVDQFRELASCTGTRAGCESMSDLIKYLKSIGWTRIWDLPAPLVAQIHALAKFFGTTASTYNFSLFVLPAGALKYDVTDTLYPQIEG